MTVDLQITLTVMSADGKPFDFHINERIAFKGTAMRVLDHIDGVTMNLFLAKSCHHCIQMIMMQLSDASLCSPTLLRAQLHPACQHMVRIMPTKICSCLVYKRMGLGRPNAFLDP